MHELQRDDFYLDHLIPRSEGGQNYESNLVASCKTCNTKKNAMKPNEFLLQNYRKGLLTQKEYQFQKDKLEKSIKEYKTMK